MEYLSFLSLNMYEIDFTSRKYVNFVLLLDNNFLYLYPTVCLSLYMFDVCPSVCLLVCNGQHSKHNIPQKDDSNRMFNNCPFLENAPLSKNSNNKLRSCKKEYSKLRNSNSLSLFSKFDA